MHNGLQTLGQCGGQCMKFTKFSSLRELTPTRKVMLPLFNAKESHSRCLFMDEDWWIKKSLPQFS